MCAVTGTRLDGLNLTLGSGLRDQGGRIDLRIVKLNSSGMVNIQDGFDATKGRL